MRRRIALLGVTAALIAAIGAGAQSGREIIRAGPDLGLPFSPAVRAGGFIYLAGTLATDDSGRVTGDDIRAQTRKTLDNLGVVLKAAGIGMENVASVTVYLKNAADFQGMNEVYRTYWPKDPPVRTTVVGDFVLPGGLVEISMIAIPAGGERRVIRPEGWAAPANPYSYGILSGDTLFLCGLVARNPKDNSVVAGGVQAQTRAIMDNGGEILKAAGMSHEHVVSSRVYIPDAATFQDMNTAYRSYFPKDPPARATVVTGLMGPAFGVEITMLAVKGASRQALVTPNADGSPGRANPNLSSAIVVGNRMFLSGMLGNNETNKGDMKAQTRETLARIERTLRAGGFGWDNVVDGVVYITDVARFAAMNEAYREIYKSDFPARATVKTGLVSPDGLVEIMFTAVK